MSDPIFKFAGDGNPFGLNELDYKVDPTFVDIDNDGDLDAFIGDMGGDSRFFRNTGTINNPAFSSQGYNLFGLSSVAGYASPIFVDIDDDNDLDAFIGDGGGNIQFFRNTGTANNPVFSDAIANPFGLINVESKASPTFVDIDGDNDLDAFVGNSYDGTLFFRNTGTVNNPIFSDPAYNPFGLSDLVNINNASPTFADIDNDKDLDAFIGSYNGDTQFFRNIGTPNGPAFASPEINPFGVPTVGYFATPETVDIDSDGDLDAFIGNQFHYMAFLVNRGLLTASTSGNDNLNGTMSTNDTATYASAASEVTVSLLTARQQDTIGAGLDTLTSIENLVGSKYTDSLIGDAGHNVLTGLGGKDILIGWSGADTLIGGIDNDTYFVGDVDDKVIEKLNEGTDTVSSKITYTLAANVENLVLTGTGAINAIGNGLANVITGNSAANQLTSGAGNDIFKFISKGSSDKITDYNVASDTVQLENAAFTALKTTGTLASGQFRVGAQAADANDFVIYNKAAGTLLYDADGSGATAATQIATLSAGLDLTNADIVVI